MDNNREKSFQLAKYPEDIIYCLEPKGLSDNQSVGVFLFMHGGDRSTPKSAPYDKYIGPNGGLRKLLEDFPYLTIAPSAPTDIDGKRWNRPGAAQYLEDVLLEVSNRYNIDQERIIIGGYSMGGFGAYHLGQLLADRAAGVWLAAGAWLEGDFRSFLGTPVYILHGKYDCASSYSHPHLEPRHHDWCGVSFARAAHELMLKYDIEHVYDEHEGGHGLNWEPTQMAVRRFLAWALRQKRQPFAPRAVLVSPRGSADPALEPKLISRWLKVEEALPGVIELDKIMLTGPNIAYTIDELEAQSYYLTKVKHSGCRIIAENLGNNHYVVQCENVKSFSIYVAPQCANVTQEFTIECNSKIIKTFAVNDNSYPPYTAKLTIEL